MSEDFPHQPSPDELKQPRGGGLGAESQHVASESGENPHIHQNLDLQTDEWTAKLAQAPIYKKTGKVKAQVAQGGEIITTTLADGADETTNSANPGDVIVTNPTGEQYIIGSEKFDSRYEKTNEDGVFKAKGKARIEPNPTGQPIKITAPWGEEQFGDADALIATLYDPDKPDEVGPDRYIIGRDEFNSTYVPDSYEDDEAKAWDMAHDEEYRREGKVEFLAEPKEFKDKPLIGSNKASVVDDLYEAYLKGENVYVDFNGTKMSSREIGELGIDSTYEKYFGYDREGFKEHSRLLVAANKASYELKQFESVYRAKKEVPELIKATSGLIKSDTEGEWRECLEVRATSLYTGDDSRSAVNLMKAHSQGRSEDDLKEMLSAQGHSGASHGMTMAIIKHFYKEGDSLVNLLG
jgi:hypothetical protein